MGDLFVSVLNMSISAAWVLLAVLLLRLVFKKAPKRITVLLWCIVGLRLVMPFSVESIFSLIPSSETVSKAWDSPRPSLDSGITAIDNGVNNYLEGHYFEGVTRPAGHFTDITTIAAAAVIAGIAASVCLLTSPKTGSSRSDSLVVRDYIVEDGCEGIVYKLVSSTYEKIIYLSALSGLINEKKIFISVKNLSFLKPTATPPARRKKLPALPPWGI